MFEHVKVTGEADSWIAIPDGYEPKATWHDRVAVGAGTALELLREANTTIGKLPRGGLTLLVVRYSEVLADDPTYGRQIKQELESIKRNGKAVGVVAEKTQDVRRLR